MKIYIEENGVVHERAFTEPMVGIGRGKDNEITISDPRSSRHHCRVLDTPNGFYLEDLQSRNGTFLNGARITKEALREGDTIEIGSTRFHFQVEPATDPDVTVNLPRGEEELEPTPTPSTVGDVAVEEVYLEGLDGVYSGRKIPITKLPYTIGRHASNAFRVEDPRASGSHAHVVRRGEAFWLEDLDSRNGTFVNGKQIKESPLVSGSRIRIGNREFRIHAPALQDGDPGQAVFADSAVGAEVVGEDEFANFDVQEFLSDTEGVKQQPLLVAGILLVMGAILYLTVDITLKRIKSQRLDPAPPTNRIVDNWSFESEIPESGEVVGWSLLDEGTARLRLTRGQGVQWPGKTALEVVPMIDGVALVQAASQPIGVDPGASYSLSGHVVNRDAVAAGFVVSWLREGAEGPVDIARSFTTAVRADGAEELNVRLRAPKSATEARIGCFVLQGEASSTGAVFDRVYFGTVPAPWLEEELSVAANESSPNEAGDTESSEPGEENEVSQTSTPTQVAPTLAAPVALKAKQPQGTLHADVQRNGVVANIRRAATPAILRLYPGLPLRQDPFAIGPSMAMPVVFGRLGGLKMMTEVPDARRADWFSVEMRMRETGSEIECRYRFHKGDDGKKLPESVALILELPKVDGGLTAFDSEGKSVEIGETASPFSLTEFVLGKGADRIVLRFDLPTSIRYVPADRHRIRGVIVVVAKPSGEKTRDFKLAISTQARQEDVAVRQTLEEVKRFRSERKLADALALLRDLRSNYPWRDFGEVSRLEAKIRDEASVVAQELAREVELLERLPSPFLRRFITERGEALREQLGVSGAIRQTLEQLLNRIDAIWKRDGSRALQARRLVEQADIFYKDGRIHLADVYVKEAKLLDIGDKNLDRRISDLSNLIEINRKGRARGLSR